MAFAIAACGDNIPGLTVDEYPVAYRAAWCRWQVRCGLLPTVESCAQLGTWPVDHDWRAAIEAGIVEFHPDAAAACVASLDALGCDPTTAEYRAPMCIGITTGTLGDGDACALSEECISGECWLESEPCQEACCRGYCVGDDPPTPGQIGERCRYSDCLEGYCDGSTCVALLAEGSSCIWTAQCEIGLSCDGTCKPLPAAGEPCIHRCREHGQMCSSETQRCERVRFANEKCWWHGDCSPFYECSTQGRCVSTLGTAGDGCSWFDDCAAPYVCDVRDTNVCVLPKIDGERCHYDVECASGSCSYGLRSCTSETCI